MSEREGERENPRARFYFTRPRGRRRGVDLGFYGEPRPFNGPPRRNIFCGIESLLGVKATWRKRAYVCICVFVCERGRVG